MRLLFVLLLPLCLSIPTLADKEINLHNAPGSGNEAITGDEFSGELPESGNYDNHEYQGENRINSLSGWGNDKSDFKLYNPRFDDGNGKFAGSD